MIRVCITRRRAIYIDVLSYLTFTLHLEPGDLATLVVGNPVPAIFHLRILVAGHWSYRSLLAIWTVNKLQLNT